TARPGATGQCSTCVLVVRNDGVDVARCVGRQGAGECSPAVQGTKAAVEEVGKTCGPGAGGPGGERHAHRGTGDFDRHAYIQFVAFRCSFCAGQQMCDELFGSFVISTKARQAQLWAVCHERLDTKHLLGLWGGTVLEGADDTAIEILEDLR